MTASDRNATGLRLPPRTPVGLARARAARAAMALLALACPACGLHRQSEFPLAPGVSVLFGRVLRQGQPVSGQLVKLYDANGTVLLDSLRSDPSGSYGFPSAPVGDVMVKASATDPLAFAYVRYTLHRASASERDSIPPLDVFAYGCRHLSPARGENMPAPAPAAPLGFRWTEMSPGGVATYKVELADAQDSTVWESVRGVAASATFDGRMTQGPRAGLAVGPGAYHWRVKVRLGSGVQAATAVDTIVFTARAGGGPP